MEEELKNILNNVKSKQSINDDDVHMILDLFLKQQNFIREKCNEIEQKEPILLEQINFIKNKLNEMEHLEHLSKQQLEQSIEMNKKYKELKESNDNHKGFIVYVYNSLKENQENTYNLLSEQSGIIDSIKSKLTDGEYLKLMNNFKKVNDSVNDINEIYDYVDQNKLMRFLEEEKEEEES